MEYAVKINLASRNNYYKPQQLIILLSDLVSICNLTTLEAKDQFDEFMTDYFNFQSEYGRKDLTKGDSAELIILRTPGEIHKSPQLIFGSEPVILQRTTDEVTPFDKWPEVFGERYGYGCTQYASDYGEPGYGLAKDKHGILFDNWNSYPKYALELLGHYYELEWEDEWAVLANCKAYRTKADSYGWESSIYMSDGWSEYFTWEEIANEPQLIEDDFVNVPNKALPSNFPEAPLLEMGFKKQGSEFANGWYPGQTDDPKDIQKHYISQNHDVLFQLNGVGQFDIHFVVWIRPQEVTEYAAVA